MIRGGIYHRVLQRTFEELRGRLTESQLPNARSIALGELRAACAAERLRRHATRSTRRSARALETDVLRYLAFAARSGTVLPARALRAVVRHEPRRRGRPVVLGDELRLSGRIDRVDVGAGRQRRRSSSTTRASPARPPQARWGEDGNLQVGLYALALPSCCPSCASAGALYQPINGDGPATARVRRRRRRRGPRGHRRQRSPGGRRRRRAARRGAGSGAGTAVARAARGRDPAPARPVRLRRRALRAPVDLPVRAVSPGPDRTLLEDRGRPPDRSRRPPAHRRAGRHRPAPRRAADGRRERRLRQDDGARRALRAVRRRRRDRPALPSSRSPSRDAPPASCASASARGSCRSAARPRPRRWRPPGSRRSTGSACAVLSSHAVVAGLDPALTVLDPADAAAAARAGVGGGARRRLLGTPGRRRRRAGALEIVDRFGYGAAAQASSASLYDELARAGGR